MNRHVVFFDIRTYSEIANNWFTVETLCSVDELTDAKFEEESKKRCLKYRSKYPGQEFGIVKRTELEIIV